MLDKNLISYLIFASSQRAFTFFSAKKVSKKTRAKINSLGGQLISLIFSPTGELFSLSHFAARPVFWHPRMKFRFQFSVQIQGIYETFIKTSYNFNLGNIYVFKNLLHHPFHLLSSPQISSQIQYLRFGKGGKQSFRHH